MFSKRRWAKQKLNHMKNQSPLFLASHQQARSPFLWAMALRIRQQHSRRTCQTVGPAPDSVVEFMPRRNAPVPQN